MIVFLIWAVQIVILYRRQAEKIEIQVQLALTNQEEIAQQAEEYETQAADLSEQLAGLKSELENLEKTEKGLEQEVEHYRRQGAERRPTRHRVEPEQSAG